MQKHTKGLAEVQAGIDGLLPLVTRAIELDAELQAARRALGEDPGRSILRSRIADVIGWRLGTMLSDLNRPRFACQRRPLVELEGEKCLATS